MATVTKANVKLTKARRHGLQALAVTGVSRRSNVTSMGSANDPRRRTTVYWQTGDWLVDHGLAVYHPLHAGDFAEGYRITDYGRAALAGGETSDG